MKQEEFNQENINQEESKEKLALTAIAYAETSLGVSTNLKQRLFNRIRQEAEVLEFVKLGADLKWKPHPVKGLQMAILKIDRPKRELSALVRAEVTVEYSLHRHEIGEEILMIEGELIENGIIYRAGDYLHSVAGSLHAPTAMAGCMFFVRTSLDDVFL